MPAPAASADVIRVADWLPRSRASGPGLRSVVWVQGCPLRCPGCFNPAFLAFAGGSLVSAADLAARLLAVSGVEGVTFSGGEPLAQAAALARVARELRAAGRSVVVFTGYSRGELLGSRDPGWRALLAAADLLVAGPYERDRPSRQPLRASANQELLLSTERYRGHDFGAPGRRVEIRIGRRGEVAVTGFPPRVLELES